MTVGYGLYLARAEKDQGRVNDVIRQLIEGRSNAVGAVTLTHDGSATSTTVTAQNCGPTSAVFLSPTTAHAAAVVTTTYISAVAAGAFTVTHAATTNADVTFSYVCLG